MPVEHEVTIAGRTLGWREGESLLESLERQQVDIPSSCRAGACHSCLVKAEQGTPPAMAQLGLKENWKQQGLFLACMCTDPRPLSIALPDSGLSTAAVLVDKQALAEDVVRLRFTLALAFSYRAGQFVNLTRADGLTRSYSIASVPGDAQLELHVRRAPGGKMSGYLYDEIKLGDSVTLRGPQGDCFYADGRPQQPLLLVATGTGLAPMIGIARDALRQGHRGAIWLVHGGRSRPDLYLHDELSSLAAAHANVRYLAALSGKEVPPEMFRGRVTELVAQQLPDLTGFRLFACGSPPMVKEIKQQAYKAGANLEDLLADAFVSAPAPATAAKPLDKPVEKKAKRSLPIIAAGSAPGPAPAAQAMPTRQKWRFAIQALTLAGFLAQGFLYYLGNFRPLGGLLPFMAYDSLGHMMVSSALLVWGFLFLLVLIFGRFVCGWLCPLGFMQDAGEKLLRRLGVKLPKPTTQPRFVRVLTTSLILSQFVLLPLLSAPLHLWQFDLHYKEPWLLGFPFRPWLFALDLLLVFLVIGILLPLFLGPRPYCKLVCETGYLLDLTSRWSFGRIRRNTGFDRDTCLSCQRCTNICPQGIKVDEEVHLFDRVVNTACIGCQQCVGTCPNNTIVYSLRKRVLDTGRAAGYLASLNTQLTDLPRFVCTGIGAVLGAWLGFVVLPPSYFHTYLLLTSLGGLFGFLCWRLAARPWGGQLETDLAAKAHPQVEREKRERLLPLSADERREAAAEKAPLLHRALPRVLIALGALALVSVSAWAVYAAVPPRIQDIQDLAPTTPAARRSHNVLHLGVPSIHSTDVTHQAYVGLPAYLSQRLKRQVRLVSAHTYTELAWAVADGRVDAALVPAGAAHAVLKRAAQRVDCVAQVERAGARTYRSVIVSGADGPRTLAEVSGKRVAFVTLDSLSGYWAPWTLLNQHGVTLGSLSGSVVAGDHSEALKLLRAKRVDVAVTFDEALEAQRARFPGETLRVLGSISGLPNDVLLVSRSLAHNQREALLRQLKGLFTDPEAAEIRAHLADAAGVTGLAPASAADLQVVERWMH
jgi:NAD(P)H-flavin reductase/ABC-type phosphate/phosphonate transport system substrate-binding protein/polyferredoxin/ferredoxin